MYVLPFVMTGDNFHLECQRNIHCMVLFMKVNEDSVYLGENFLETANIKYCQLLFQESFFLQQTLLSTF